MKTEIEAKFVQVDHNDIRKRLNQLGAKCEQPMRDMVRVTIDTPSMKAKDAFVRIRDQGDKVTVTYKQFDELSVDGAKEIEITVDDFDNAVALFAAAGLHHRSWQESKRETWILDDVEIVLDEWPWLDTYIEIEGPSKKSVKDVAKRLGFDWDDAVFGDVMAAYRLQYPHLNDPKTIGNIAKVKFGDPLPELLKP